MPFSPCRFPVRAAAVAAAALLAALALTLLAAPARAGAKPLFGVQVDSITPATTRADIASQLRTAARVRARAIRVEADWSALEPRAQGQHDAHTLAALDAVVAGAKARGIKVLLFLDRSPCWASSAPDKGSCSAPNANRFDVTRYPPADPQSYVPMATFLAQRYGDALGAFEIWNEPDQANEKYWAGPDKVRRYVDLMKAVYQPLKAIDPRLPVIAGSFVGTDGAWLKAMYDAGAKGFYDGLAVHFYDLPLYGLEQTRAVQRAHGDRAPLWLTEYGWTSCRRGHRGPSFLADHPCVTRREQARALADVVRAVAGRRWIKAASVYTLHDQSHAYQFGILDRRGHRKPAFRALRRELGRRRPGHLRRPTLHLREAAGRLVIGGRGSIADVYVVRVFAGSQLLYRGYVRTTMKGTYSTALPSQLGTNGLRVRLSSMWSGAGVTRSR
ncbi:MAG TPA: cellulase family glycosylhydrolase [Baekduia sp.]|nr:cellulase family glycosylhydrolase [Baekduia sp.]